jgi:uncharacterized protein (TIGR02300 family)
VANGPALGNGTSMTAAAKADLGTKRICPTCAARFYDLQKRPIECPKCQTTFEPEALFRTRRPRQPEPEPVSAGAAAAEDVEETEDENEEAETEEAEELTAAEPPIAGITDEDEEEAEVTEEQEAAGAGMSVVSDVEGADIEDIEEEDVGEDEADDALLEDVEEDGDDVVGIIDPGIGKDER